MLATAPSTVSKILFRYVENLSMPSNRAHQIVLGTLIVNLERIPRRIWNDFDRIWCWIFNMKIQCFGIFVPMVWATKKLIILFDRVRRTVLGTLVKILGAHS